jgi:ribose transport system permease protein
LTLNKLNIITGETLTLVLVALVQTIVILTGGIDLSIGGIVSLTTALAALHFGNGGPQMWLWMAGLIIGATVAGAGNGLLIALTRMQPFIVTLATWSIFGGIALWVLPTTGGSVPQMWVNVGNGTWLGIGSAVWILAALVILWHVFKRTRPAVAIRSVGSSQEAAYLCGVPIVRTITSAYAISGLCGALAGLYYITQATSGSPTAGNDYILPSVVAVVIGGTSLAGGRGGFGGTLAGAFILTLIGNVIFIFGIQSNWQLVFEGLLLMLTVALNVVVGYAMRRRGAR